MKLLFPVLTAIVLTAVSIYAFVLTRDWNSDAAPPGDPRSGALRLVDPNPKAGIDDFGSFAWYYTLPQGGYYKLSIVNLDSGETVVDELRVDQPDWRPKDEQLRGMGDHIEVFVRAFAADSDEPLASTRRELRIDD